jgi:alpha-galactosidase
MAEVEAKMRGFCGIAVRRVGMAAGIFLAGLLMAGGLGGVARAQAVLAATPPMGWNSWNHFAERVTDADVRAAADAMVASGMRDAGYVYVNIDDTWEGERDAKGVIHTNKKFPDMKALADYVHSKGMKLGIYSSPGPKTCAGYAGSYGHEEQDAATYAAWGVDYLKYDLCSYREVMDKESGGDAAKANAMMRAAYEKMHQAIVKAGRPVVYSFCQYGWDAVWEWGPSVGANLWRTTGDISDNYDRMSVIGFSQAGLGGFAGPGHWNDPDMLEVGNGKMTRDEYLTHMSLWAVLAAPLLAGNDLGKMTEETKNILLNRDVIAIDQDALGKQGNRVLAIGPEEVWTKPLKDGMAIALFNRGEDALPVTLRLKDVGLKAGVKAKDVWSGETMKLPLEKTFVVPRHGLVLLRVEK